MKEDILQKGVISIDEKDTGILIKWNRESGDYQAFFKGQPLHITSMEALFKSIIDYTKNNLDKDGFVIFEPEEKQLEPDQEWSPPWKS